MIRTKRLLFSMLTLLCCTGVWALEQDSSDGYYKIGSVQDWTAFAELVQTTPTANAKMIADVNLGDNQTHIGPLAQQTADTQSYSGTFDGQGHTLTVAYTGSGEQVVAPFTHVSGATIKNLHVAGTIQSTFAFNGLVGLATGTGNLTISNVWLSAEISSTQSNWSWCGAFIGCIWGTVSASITDCLFTGSLICNNGTYANGCFAYKFTGSATITNCLSTGTFSYGSGVSFDGTHTNCYVKQFPKAFPDGVIQATDETLSNGTVTTALQANRSEEVWVQDAVTNMPMLATFANAVTLTDVNDLTALSAYAGKTCKVTYSRSFTEAKSSTVCLPFAFAKGSVGTFYTFTGISKNEIGEYIATMTEYTGDNLVANTPYLFTPSATSDVDFSGTYEIPDELVAGSTVSNGWTFKGTYTTIEWTTAPATPTYGFSASSANDGITQGQFVKVGSYVRIKPMRCYLENANFTGARGMTRAADEPLPETIKVRLIGADGEVTAIGSLQTKTGEVTFDKDTWYSLDGRRIEGKPSAKGIYVNNGKKVIIK